MNYKVLIIDDCPVMRTIIRRVIGMTGLEVDCMEAENGKSGLNFIRSNDFDLAIVDLNMPVMSGAEMIASVRMDPSIKYVPILTVSAESNQTKLDVLDTLVDGSVHKPFSAEDLSEKILKVLEKKSIMNQEQRSFNKN